MLSHLVSEVEKNETGALMFCASWIEDAGVFYLIEGYVSRITHDDNRSYSEKYGWTDHKRKDLPTRSLKTTIATSLTRRSCTAYRRMNTTWPRS